MSQPPTDPPAAAPWPPQQQPHPGYGQTPPAGGTPRHPGYGPNPSGAGGAPSTPGAPGQPGQPGSSAARPNPLGLASLVLGAIGPVLGFLFVFIQAGMLSSGGTSAFAAVSVTQSVLVGLTSLAALILGLVAISRPGSPKALASAGLALGAAGLLGVLSAILYPVLLNLMYI